jgi:predicted O-linked N-acetylglucosamine transferase (SPINDLY family)
MTRQTGSESSAALPADPLHAVPRRQVLEQLYALAVAQYRAGLTEAAIQTYQRCLALSPDSPEIHNNLGTALDRAGRLSEAVQCFQRALALNPSYVRPLVNLGKVLRLQGQPSESVALLERALSLSPDNPSALTNLGFALADLGRRQDAIRALRRATELDPGLAEAYHGLGRVLLDSGDAAGAVNRLRRAVALRPAFTDACLLLATSLLAAQRLSQALGVVEQVLEQVPDNAEALAVAMSCCLRMCEWDKVEHLLERSRALQFGVSHTQPFLLMAVSDDPEEHLQSARVRASTAAGGRIALPPPRTWKHERIRVAYVSGDFYSHATSFLLAELLELHDRAAFQVFGVSFGPDDRSPLRARVLAAFDHSLDARDRSDLEVATWLREHEIDIAVDLKGYTAYCRPGILAHRSAPIQVNYLGYPGTMAAPFIDYLIADRLVIPEAEQPFYTERIAYLPGCYQANDRRRQISPHAPTRGEVGLPEEGFVFCCFNNSWKITAPVFDVWMRLLAGLPGSVLWLLEDNPWAVDNLRREASARGIAPERLAFCERASNEAHLARHRLADLFLDTSPYNAHTTASDALWTGLPVVTCAGRTFASRVAASLLRAVGLSDLVTTSLEEYERLALKLARNRNHLDSLRARLTSKPEALPLFDTPAFCKHLERAYRHMSLLQGEHRNPETFAVEDLTAGRA